MRFKFNIAQWLFVVISLVFIAHPNGQLFAEAEKFSLSKDSAAAVVSSKTFDITVDVGATDDYPENPKIKEFELNIGEKCNFKIEASYIKNIAVMYKLKFNGDSSPNLPAIFNLKEIKITDKNIAFNGSTSNGASNAAFDCEPVFKEHPADNSKFLINVELKGDIPVKLVLSSSTVDMYDGVYAELVAKDGKEDESTGFPTWAIIVIVVGVTVLLLVVLVIVGIVVYRRFMKRKKENEQKDTNHDLSVQPAKIDEKLLKRDKNSMMKSASKEQANKKASKEAKKTTNEEESKTVEPPMKIPPLPGLKEKSSSIEPSEQKKPDKSQKVIDKVDANAKVNASPAPPEAKGNAAQASPETKGNAAQAPPEAKGNAAQAPPATKT